MHSTLVRLQNVFGFFTTVAFCTAVLVALSVTLSPQDPSATLELRNVQVISVKGRPHYYSTKQEEYAHIKFDLDADFSSLFNWNTKQLFVYIQATWPSSKSSRAPPSQAIIWDTIINSHSQTPPLNPLKLLGLAGKPSKKSAKSKKSSPKNEQETIPGIIRLRNSKPKYQITNIDGKLASIGNVTLEVGWNVQPWVGALTWTQGEGQNWGRWDGIRGGKCKAFDFPSLKGKSAIKETVIASPRKPKPADASAVV